MQMNQPEVFDLAEYLHNLTVQNKRQGARKAYKTRMCRMRSLENYRPYTSRWEPVLVKSWTSEGAHDAVRPYSLYAGGTEASEPVEEETGIIYAKDAAEFRALTAAS